eukprot:TRINITY_DN4637_c0_g1_i5.p1 TRINITY_DN4637_c0_g1~~TRINITY_DN4637_c0_g1_i5.p1  ORF type:complete len:243 (+),score=29.61 TRINITY_DN4637_c0_g1_i5:72-800(+)
MSSIFRNQRLIAWTEVSSVLIGIVGPLIILGHLIRDVHSTSLFFWHPIMQTVAFMLFIPQLAIMMRGNLSLLREVMEAFVSKERKVQLYLYGSTVATVVYILGGVTMYNHKHEIMMENPLLAHMLEGDEAEHFLTWHATLGIITGFLGAFVNLPLGIIIGLHSLTQRCFTSDFYESLLECYKFTTFGIYILGTLTLSLALFSDFISQSLIFFRFVLGIALAILLLTMTLNTFKEPPQRVVPN